MWCLGHVPQELLVGWWYKGNFTEKVHGSPSPCCVLCLSVNLPPCLSSPLWDGMGLTSLGNSWIIIASWMPIEPLVKSGKKKKGCPPLWGMSPLIHMFPRLNANEQASTKHSYYGKVSRPRIASVTQSGSCAIVHHTTLFGELPPNSTYYHQSKAFVGGMSNIGRLKKKSFSLRVIIGM